MSKYIEGTIIQRRNHYRYVKINGMLKAEHRVVAEQKLIHRELLPNERVFHRDCSDVADNRPESLVVIKYRTNKFRPLPESRVVYIPRRVAMAA